MFIVNNLSFGNSEQAVTEFLNHLNDQEFMTSTRMMYGWRFPMILGRKPLLVAGEWTRTQVDRVLVEMVAHSCHYLKSSYSMLT